MSVKYPVNLFSNHFTDAAKLILLRWQFRAFIVSISVKNAFSDDVVYKQCRSFHVLFVCVYTLTCHFRPNTLIKYLFILVNFAIPQSFQTMPYILFVCVCTLTRHYSPNTLIKHSCFLVSFMIPQCFFFFLNYLSDIKSV